MKVRIKNVTGSTGNEWLLWELKKEAGVKEGDIYWESFLYLASPHIFNKSSSRL